MASNNNFSKKDGSISSSRVSIYNGKSKISLSNYNGSTRGGVTFKNNAISSRFNNKGQSMGTSMKVGSNTKYYGVDGMHSNKIKQF